MLTPTPNPKISIKVIYEDEALAIVDKAAHMPVHPLKPHENDTLANGLVAKWPELTKVGEDPREAGLVHRLDNNTSGLLLVAKTNEAWKTLREMLSQELIEKQYLALVMGEPPRIGLVRNWIAHHPKDERKMICIDREVEAEEKKAKPAWTIYNVKAQYKGYALVRVRIGLGSRHQIRVHLASIHHPLAKDSLYQSQKERQEDRLHLNRHFLHAAQLSFLHPIKKEIVSFESPLPRDLQSVLDQLASEVRRPDSNRNRNEAHRHHRRGGSRDRRPFRKKSASGGPRSKVSAE